MTPPEAPQDGTARPGKPPPAVPVSARPALTTLRNRRDFLAAARGRAVATPGMIVQARKRPPGEGDGIRVGFTCSKKIGNAVTRNRARRRLREVARRVLSELGREGWDYVLIGRRDATVSRPFDALARDLTFAVNKLHGARE